MVVERRQDRVNIEHVGEQGGEDESAGAGRIADQIVAQIGSNGAKDVGGCRFRIAGYEAIAQGHESLSAADSATDIERYRAPVEGCAGERSTQEGDGE